MPNPSSVSSMVNLNRFHQSHTGKHRHASITSFASTVYTVQCSEKIFFVNTELASLLQSAGKHVQDQFAVRIGVDVAVRLVIEIAP